jgi:hypothetical protein
MFLDGWTALLRREPYRVDWLAPSGELRRGRPLPFDRVPLDAAQRRAAIRAKYFGDEADVLVERDFPSWPRYLPPFLSESITPLADGSVMIRRAPDARLAGTRHDVVDRDGALRHSVLLAPGQRVVGSDARGVFVATRSEGDFEVLTVHSITSRR